MNWGWRIGSGVGTAMDSVCIGSIFSRVLDDSSESSGRIDFMPVSKKGGIGAVILVSLRRGGFAGGTYPSSGQLELGRWLSGAQTGADLEMERSAFKFGVTGTIGTRSVLITSRISTRKSFQGTKVTFGSPTNPDSSDVRLTKSFRISGRRSAVLTVFGSSSFSLLQRLFGPDDDVDQVEGMVE
jgi:hypothetical protein